MSIFLAGIAVFFGLSTLMLLLLAWRAPVMSDDRASQAKAAKVTAGKRPAQGSIKAA